MTKIMPANKKSVKSPAKSKQVKSVTQPRETQETLENAFSEAISVKSTIKQNVTDDRYVFVVHSLASNQMFSPTK